MEILIFIRIAVSQGMCMRVSLVNIIIYMLRIYEATRIRLTTTSLEQSHMTSMYQLLK
jgi:hypothetical protein